MTQNNENISNQINRDLAGAEISSFGLNPDNAQNVAFQPNFQAATPNSSVGKSYDWAYRYFSYTTNDLITLNQDALNNAQDRIGFYEYPSTNGNLTKLNVEPNIIHSFSANLFKKNFGSTKIYLNWSGAIGFYINSGSFIRTDKAGFESTELNLGFNSGWNNLEIFLYTNVGSSFSLNSEIGLFSDEWQTPSFTEPETPQGFSVVNDSGFLQLRDPNSTILRWDSTPPSRTFGYNLYRRGPYFTGVNVPSIDAALSTGYFVSGAIGVNQFGNPKEAFYTISAKTSSGETLPSEIIKVPLTPIFSGVDFISVEASGIAGGNLAQELYTYSIGANNPIGFKFPILSSVGIFNSGNCVVINWSGANNVDGYNIYRYSGAINDTDIRLGFVTGSLISQTPNNIFYYIDTGIVAQSITGIRELGSNFENTNIFNQNISNFKNNSSYLKWPQPTASDTGLISYNIYRTFYSGVFDKNSFIGNTTSLFFIDSGINPSTGKPTKFENLIALNYGTTKYKDIGLVSNQLYDYRISSYNYSLVESPYSTGINIVVGDPFAPATPSGITITSFNGFATLGWINGNEPDLAGTNIYKSEILAGPYNIIGTTQGTTFSTFIGYSGSPYFKLSNFDTSENESPLSAAYQGSGTMTVENIILKSFYTWDALENEQVIFPFSPQNGIIEQPTITLDCVTTGFKNQNIIYAGLVNNGSYVSGFLSKTNSVNSNLGRVSINLNYKPAFFSEYRAENQLSIKYVNPYIHIAFINHDVVSVRTYNDVSQTPITTGWLDIPTWGAVATANLPKVIAMSGFGKPVSVVYQSGNSINIASLNISGLVLTPITVLQGISTTGEGMTACFDNNFDLHLAISSGNGISLRKYSYTTGVNASVTLLNTLFINSANIANTKLNYPSMECDSLGNIHLFTYNKSRADSFTSTETYYSQIDTNSYSVRVNPVITSYSTKTILGPKYIDINKYTNTIYGVNGEYYSFGPDPDFIQKTSGCMLKSYLFKNFTNPTLYEIITATNV